MMTLPYAGNGGSLPRDPRLPTASFYAGGPNASVKPLTKRTSLGPRGTPLIAEARQRAGDAFQGHPLGLDADRDFDERRADHQTGTEKIAVNPRAALARADQCVEQKGRGDTAERGAE